MTTSCWKTCYVCLGTWDGCLSCQGRGELPICTSCNECPVDPTDVGYRELDALADKMDANRGRCSVCVELETVDTDPAPAFGSHESEI